MKRDKEKQQKLRDDLEEELEKLLKQVKSRKSALRKVSQKK